MATVKHLLVIRLSAMGDVAMTVPVLTALTKTYPELKITVLTRGFFKPIFSQLPNVTIYEPELKGNHKGIIGLYKLYTELKALKIDAVADLHNVLRTKILKLYFSFGKIPVVQIDKGRAEKKALTTLKVDKQIQQLKTTHERYADVFSKLGFPLLLGKVTLNSKINLSQALTNKIAGNDQKWIGIAPFAAFSGKMYLLDLMEKVVAELNNTEKYKIILFGGGAKEEAILNQWETTYNQVVNMANKVSFKEELALISNLALMVAMDSGNAHLAANYAIPTITLWGVTHPYAGFYPFGQDTENALLSDRSKYPLIPTSVYGNKYPEGYENVMATIAPESIVSKIEKLLN
jgi:ADP-heptose:LPS heptosyltransferase